MTGQRGIGKALKMKIEYRNLTKEEAQASTHFCGRCESWQKRFELHNCVPTDRWKAAKAAMGIARGASGTGANTLPLTVNQQEIVPETAVSASEAGENDEFDARD
jgi:hypothetical protein